MTIICYWCEAEIEVSSDADKVLRGIGWRRNKSMWIAVKRAQGEPVEPVGRYECVSCVRERMAPESPRF